MKRKKIYLCFLSMLLLISLVSCEVSSYSAIGLVKISKDNYCDVSFYKLNGKLVFNPRYTKSEGEIHYVASLDEGEINVYYECIGNKELLFNIKAGERIDSYGGYIEKGKQTIIVETVAPARGSIKIEFV